MRINTALILCAGFGKRLNPITLNTPKPLLEIKDVSMLERCINLIEKLGIKKVKDWAHNYCSKHNGKHISFQFI